MEENEPAVVPASVSAVDVSSSVSMTASTCEGRPIGERADAAAHPDQGEQPEQRDDQSDRAVGKEARAESAKAAAQPEWAPGSARHGRNATWSPTAVGRARTSGASSDAYSTKAAGGSTKRFG